MAERSIVVRLRAEIADFQRRMREAGKSTADVKDAANQAGAALTAFGAIGVGALGLSAKAAIEWESAWAGVTKTVDGTAAEMASLEGELRSMARSLPATHGEIAAVAEAAGQLGIKRADIAGFTKVMVDLGETTNLSAEEAATSIAQMMNVMQTAPEDVGRLASTLVALGNAGASTEKQIIEMSQRIAGAGAVVGLSEGEVLAFSNAVASMGIDVEAGGSSVSRVLTTMAKSVATGSAELGVFAETAGMSAEEFSRAFKEGPAEATATFIEGLGGIQEAGGNVFGVLDDLGLSDIRVSQALLGMASSGDLLRDSLDLQAVAWEQNTALQEEAGKRYDTTAAQMAIAKNNVVDAAISFGQVLLPAIKSASAGVRDFAGFLSDLPTSVQGLAVGMVGLASGTALFAGGLLLTVPRVVETYQAFRLLKAAAEGSATAMKVLNAVRLAGTLGAVGLGAAALTLGIKALAQSMTEVPATTEEATKALLDLQDAADTVALEAMFDNISTDAAVGGVDDLGSAFDRLTDRHWDVVASDWANGLVGLSTQASRSSEQFETLGQSLASMVESGNIDLAEASFDAMVQQLGLTGDEITELRELMPAYGEALKGVANQETLNVESAKGAAAAIGGVGDTAMMTAEQIEESMKALEEWRAELQTIGHSFVEPMAVYTGLLAEKTEAEQAAAQATADATESAEDSWEDFAGTTTVSLDEYATKLEEMVKNQEAWRTNVVKVSQRGGLEVAQILTEMGAEGAQITADMADATDAEFNRMAKALIADARQGGAGAAAALDQEMKVMAAVGAAGADATAKGIAKELGIGVGEVEAIATRYGVKLAAGINPLLGALGKKRISVGGSGGIPEGFAEGGVLPGYTPGRDVHRFVSASGGMLDLSGGEAIMRPEWTRAVGSDYVSSANAAAKAGQPIPAFAAGGVWGGPGDVPKPPSTSPYRAPISTAGNATTERAYGEAVEWMKANAAPALGPGIGWKAQMAALRTEFPGLALNSGFRPGAITATGNPSYHGMGRAVDIPPRLDVNKWIYDNYKAQTKELIFSVPGARQVNNGSDHTYTGITKSMHYDHNHWAMAEGGILNPHIRDGGGPLRPGFTFNGTGGLEDVVPRTTQFADTAAYGAAPRQVGAQAGPLIGSVNIEGYRTDQARAVVDELGHEMRRIRRGGVHTGAT